MYNKGAVEVSSNDAWKCHRDE